LKFRLLDVLVCPKCNGYPLVLLNYATETIETQKKPRAVLCKKFCGMKGKSPSKVDLNDCETCLSIEVVAGELVCKSCGARYGIYKGVPSFLIG